MKYPRSPGDKVGEVVYFGRMVDKIRLMASGDLHPDLHNNLGKGFDGLCLRFLGVTYDDLANAVRGGLADEAALEWAFQHGRQRDSYEIEVWNEYLRKWGWNDGGTEILDRRKKEGGFENREEIRTMFNYIDADEGRPVRP